MPLSKYAREERNRVIAAFQRLGMPPDVLEGLRRLEPAEVHQASMPHRLFQPPVFRRYHQSPEEWKVLADAEWQKYRDGLMAVWESWEAVDGPVAQPKPRRGPGKTGRNASIEQRYEWAALRLAGREWKDIAGQYRKCRSERELRAAEDAVRKAATEILKIAGFDLKTWK